MLRLYMDEDSMDEVLVQSLRARAVDVSTADEAGMLAHTDAEHIEYAAREQRVVCTFNVGDFWALHSEYLAEGRSHAGIILMPQQRYSLGEQLRRLLQLATTLSPDVMVNRAEFLSSWDPVG